MSKSVKLIIAALAAAMLAACSGVPVALGSRTAGPVPTGEARTIVAESCGFQLLLLIPIAINSRQERAYQDLEQQAAGDFITDVEVQERWQYGFVGTLYCTKLQAKAIRQNR